MRRRLQRREQDLAGGVVGAQEAGVVGKVEGGDRRAVPDAHAHALPDNRLRVAHAPILGLGLVRGRGRHDGLACSVDVDRPPRGCDREHVPVRGELEGRDVVRAVTKLHDRCRVHCTRPHGSRRLRRGDAQATARSANLAWRRPAARGARLANRSQPPVGAGRGLRRCPRSLEASQPSAHASGPGFGSFVAVDTITGPGFGSFVGVDTITLRSRVSEASWLWTRLRDRVLEATWVRTRSRFGAGFRKLRGCGHDHEASTGGAGGTCSPRRPGGATAIAVACRRSRCPDACSPGSASLSAPRPPPPPY